jgi:hypothetical protein
MPWIDISLPVVRVSSQAIASAPRSKSSARSVMSAALPIGTAVRYRPGAGLFGSGLLGDAAPVGSAAEGRRCPAPLDGRE